MWAREAMQVTPGGPDTHDDSHQRGATRTAARPLFVQKKTILETIKSFSISDLYNNPILHIALINSCSVK